MAVTFIFPWYGRRYFQSILKEINPKYSLEQMMLKLKCQYLVTWYEEPTHWKIPWCWERLKAGGEGDGREWDGWMASLNQWTWVWAHTGRLWRTGKPGMLQSKGSQRVRHDWANWFPLGFIGLISLLSKRLSRVFSSTTVWRHQFISTQYFLSSSSHYWKNYGFDHMDLCQKSFVSAF